VAARLADAETVTALVAEAPEELGETLWALAAAGPVVQGEHGYLPTELRWAIERGLLVSDGWDSAEMPREVSLALRGPDWHAEFVPHPPLPPLPSPTRRRRARGRGSGGGLLGAATAVLDAAPSRVEVRRIGARELKRISKATGSSEFEVGLVLELAGRPGCSPPRTRRRCPPRSTTGGWPIRRRSGSPRSSTRGASRPGCGPAGRR
jgi:hypothetical protein